MTNAQWSNPPDKTQVERGIRIKNLRDRRGVSQSQLAKLLGTTSQYISNVECGRQNTTLDWLQRVATALQGRLSELAPEVK